MPVIIRLIYSFSSACHPAHDTPCPVFPQPLQVVFFGYALAFWFGMTLRYNGALNPSTGKEWQPGNIMAIFFCVFIGSFMLLGSSGKPDVRENV